MGKRGYRKSEPYEPEEERPRLLSKMLEYHTNVLRYSHDQLADSLYLGVDEFRRIYLEAEPGQQRAESPRLRVVK